jgi:hypothetical protein
MPLLIFVVAETGVCVPLPSKLTSAYAAIPAFRPCLPSRCLVMDYSFTIVKQTPECMLETEVALLNVLCASLGFRMMDVSEPTEVV